MNIYIYKYKNIQYIYTYIVIKPVLMTVNQQCVPTLSTLRLTNTCENITCRLKARGATQHMF